MIDGSIKRKRCNIFHLEPSAERSTTHAQVPTVLVKDDVVRVYVAARNTRGKSYPFFVDFDRKDLTKIVRVSENPMQLRGWTIVDNRGNQVNVTLTDFRTGQQLADSLFKYDGPDAGQIMRGGNRN